MRAEFEREEMQSMIGHAFYPIQRIAGRAEESGD